MQDVTLAKFKQLYEKDLLKNIVQIGGYVYGIYTGSDESVAVRAEVP